MLYFHDQSELQLHCEGMGTIMGPPFNNLAMSIFCSPNECPSDPRSFGIERSIH
jgi:hypothetical protein